MGIFDKAKEALSAHPGNADADVAGHGDLSDERTGYQRGSQDDRAETLAADGPADDLRRDRPPA